MDATHFHLVWVHLPIVLVLLAVPLLIWGVFSADIRKLAFLILLCLGPMLFLAQQSGERSEDLVESVPAFSKSIAHDHEEAGELALVLGIGVSLAALALGAFELKLGRPSAAATTVLLLLTVVLAASVLRTGYLGGQVMHTEIRGNTPVLPNSEVPDDD